MKKSTFHSLFSPFTFTRPMSLLCTLLLSVQAWAAQIGNIDPRVATSGKWVNIAGVGFTSVATVKFNGVNARFRVDHDRWMSAEVPAGASSGYVELFGSQGVAKSSFIFTVGTSLPPSGGSTTTTPTQINSSIRIDNIDPRAANSGVWVNIAGTGFSAVTGVRFNGSNARFRVDHNGWMSAEVPAGAASGPVTFLSNAGAAVTSFSFTVGSVAVAPPSGTPSGGGSTTGTTTPTGSVRINNFEPKSAIAGTWIVFSGQGFVGTNSVKFGNATAAFRIDHDGWMSAQVPSAAQSGLITIAGSKGSAQTGSSFTIQSSGGPTPSSGGGTTVPVPTARGSISKEQIGLIVNLNDPQSVAVADYYKRVRGIPSQNVISVRIPVAKGLWAGEFHTMKAEIDRQTHSGIQGYALSFTQPFIVERMSIAGAIAMGYESRYFANCNLPSNGRSSYFNSDSIRPFSDHRIRPTMHLAGTSFASVKALIDRGLASDFSRPAGTGYMIKTNDDLRSSRYHDFVSLTSSWNSGATGIKMNYSQWSSTGINVLTNKQDMFFYQTGLTHVANIATNRFIPGGFGDHMTSYGGVLDESEGQMGILKWLEAGATGSYGTVIEPCAWTQKFPKTSVLMKHYYSGNTLLEAYWKSVEWPAEGAFVGDPLARPWGQR